MRFRMGINPLLIPVFARASSTRRKGSESAERERGPTLSNLPLETATRADSIHPNDMTTTPPP